MREEIIKNIRKIYGTKISKKILKRLEYEFKTIEENNLDDYLMTLSNNIKELRAKGYFINGTGCLKESLIAFLLGIIDVNPMYLNKLSELDFTKKQFEIIAPKDIQERLNNPSKEKNIQIKYSSSFVAQLLSRLESLCDIHTRNISFDDKEVLKKFIKKDTIGKTLTIADSLDSKYGMELAFGMNNEKLKTFYDYINYDKNCNGEYSMGILTSYYLTYFRVHFPDIFYPNYIENLTNSLAQNNHYKQIHKMQYLKTQIEKVYNNGYKLNDIQE